VPVEYAQTHLDLADGERLGLQVYPEPAPDAPLVVVCPAMGVPARYYRPLAAELAGHGLAVVVADLRGTGASTPRPSRRSRYGYAELAADVGAVLEHIAADGRRVVLLGHSLGGQACALHLALATEGSTVDGLALVAVGLPWYRAYRGPRARGVLVLTQWINAVSAVLRVWPGWGFGGRQARGVIRDWAYTARHGRFPRLGGRSAGEVRAGLSRVATPVLAISFDGDAFTPAATLDHLVGMLAAAPVERVHLGPAEMDASVDHFTWVRAAAPVATRVAELARGSSAGAHPNSATAASRHPGVAEP
jgi:predicted alpha/beta hydrolase